VLETARGGILRRGLALSRAGAAVVTNVSADHFGEYGIHDLDSLADVKLTVAAAVAAGGLLVLNADDPTLRAKAADSARASGAARASAGSRATPTRHRSRTSRERGATCGLREGRMQLALAARSTTSVPSSACRSASTAGRATT